MTTYLVQCGQSTIGPEEVRVAYETRESCLRVGNRGQQTSDDIDRIRYAVSPRFVCSNQRPGNGTIFQIVNLNNSVGSTERCQGGFISPAIDDDSTGTDLEMSPELTSVDILDYTLTNHINFEVLVSGLQFRYNMTIKLRHRANTSPVISFIVGLEHRWAETCALT